MKDELNAAISLLKSNGYVVTRRNPHPDKGPGWKDMTGSKFGRLTVQFPAFVKHGKQFWRCLCECGKEKDISGISLRGGRSKSCGCLTGISAAERLRKRWQAGTK